MKARNLSGRYSRIIAAVVLLAMPSAALTAEIGQPAHSHLQASVQTGASLSVNRPINASKIILVGDSTTAVVGGWGPSFCAFHVTSFLACVNLARGGRSSASYIAEGSWAIALSEMEAPRYSEIYVLIQFGHNDQPGKPGRSTDLETEFPLNLRRYVEETRSKGAIPILVTPLARRQFVGGQLQNDLSAWADAVRRVAAETDTPLVDLNAESARALQALGPMLSAQFAQVAPSQEVALALLSGTSLAASAQMAPAAVANMTVSTSPSVASSPMLPAGEAAGPADTGSILQVRADTEPMGQARIAFDYTHLGPAGANFFARMVTRELAISVPSLRRHLIP